MRTNVNLKLLPTWGQYLIAVTTAGLVMYLAWHVGHNRPTPAWLGVVQPVWLILGPALIAFFIARWLLQRFRK